MCLCGWTSLGGKVILNQGMSIRASSICGDFSRMGAGSCKLKLLERHQAVGYRMTWSLVAVPCETLKMD